MTLLLRVFSLGSRAVCRLRRALLAAGLTRAARAPLLVVSVGNIALGGSEKTPLVMDLLAFLRERGFRPALVTRGYRGSWEKSGGEFIEGRSPEPGWREAGDEPAMMARRLPGIGIFVGRHRLASCRKAKAAGFDVAVLDDGFQHIKLHRDLDIVLVGAGRPPLREGPRALRRAGIVLIKDGPQGPLQKRARREAGGPVYPYSVVPLEILPVRDDTTPARGPWNGRRILSFCGIARPERFQEALAGLGIAPVRHLPFPDHHPYPPASVRKIEAAIRDSRADAVIMTEKDAVKWRAPDAPALSVPAYFLRIGLVLPDEFRALVGERLGAGPEARS